MRSRGAPVTVEVTAVFVIDVCFAAQRTMELTDAASEEGYLDQVTEPRTSLQESVLRVESGLDHRIPVSDEIERTMHHCLRVNFICKVISCLQHIRKSLVRVPQWVSSFGSCAMGLWNRAS